MTNMSRVKTNGKHDWFKINDEYDLFKTNDAMIGLEKFKTRLV